MRSALALILLLVASAAVADEPHGCNGFAWDVSKAQALLAAATTPDAMNDRDAGKGYRLALAPLPDAHLKMPPERAPSDPQSLAGSMEFGPESNPGTYAVTLSVGVWIDLVQNGKYLKPMAFTGALDCPHARKSVKFRLGPGPFTLQMSGASAPSIDLAVTPAN